MDISIASHSNTVTNPESAQQSGDNGVKPPKAAFSDVFYGYLPGSKKTFATEARARWDEKKAVLNQLLQDMRAESEMRRQELMIELLTNNDEEETYDVYGKCLEIARRIMRGEKVSVEDMRLLGQNFPELLFQALLLKQEKTDRDFDDSKSEFEDHLMDYSGRGKGYAEIIDISKIFLTATNGEV